MPFTQIGLCDPLVKGILATGYTAPTEIQAQAIPKAIAGKDIIACAQTGTGKTAAFVLPILDRLSHKKPQKRKSIKALILTPTRELAVQIEDCVKEYSRFLDTKTLAVYGGVRIQNQIRSLHKGVDIVVSTPGRLMDHMDRGSIDLRQVEVLVLDEADRMLDMGFVRDVKEIIKEIPKDRQTLLFSATVSHDIKKLASGIMQNPETIQIGRQHNPIESVTQTLFAVPQAKKMDYLLSMLEEHPMYSVLIFSRTKHGADKICTKLKRADVQAASIHSDRTQSQRQQALDGFKRGKYQVMVATDIAARGIDVEGISHVINFDVPTYAEDYVHRIGRTGRASATGDAITLVAGDEMKYIQRIEKFISQKLKVEKIAGISDGDNYSQSSGRSGGGSRGGKGGGSRGGRPSGGARSGGPRSSGSKSGDRKFKRNDDAKSGRPARPAGAKSRFSSFNESSESKPKRDLDRKSSYDRKPRSESSSKSEGSSYDKKRSPSAGIKKKPSSSSGFARKKKPASSGSSDSLGKGTSRPWTKKK